MASKLRISRTIASSLRIWAAQYTRAAALACGLFMASRRPSISSSNDSTVRSGIRGDSP